MSKEREVEFVGRIYKCSGCGAVLKSFCAVCPECGVEIRGVESEGALDKFLCGLGECTSIDDRCDYIRNYRVPNTKEDIIEFLNITKKQVVNYDRNGDGDLQDEERMYLSAYKALADECYSRAKTLRIVDDQIEKIYTKVKTVDIDIKNYLNSEKQKDIIRDRRSKFKNTWIFKAELILIAVMIIVFLVTKYFMLVPAMVFSLLTVAMCSAAVLTGFGVIKIPSDSAVWCVYLSPVLFVVVLVFLMIGADYGKVTREREELERANADATKALDYNSQFDWEKVQLSGYAPRFENASVKLTVDEQEKLQFSLRYEEKADIDSVIAKCKQKGYVEQVVIGENSFKAYNKAGYYIEASFDGKYVDFLVEVPFSWDKLKLADKVPHCFMRNGIIQNNTENGFNISLAYASVADISKLIEECKNYGYKNKEVQSDANGIIEYKAYNEDGFYIQVKQDGKYANVVLETPFDWNSLELSDKVPHGFLRSGSVEKNAIDGFDVKLAYSDAADVSGYIEECRKAGYNINSTQKSINNTVNEYRAYNEEGYYLEIKQENGMIDILLESPFLWEDLKLSKKLPTGYLRAGSIELNTANNLKMTLRLSDNVDYVNYKQKVKDFGYNLNVTDNTNNFIGFDSEGLCLKMVCGNDTINISLEKCISWDELNLRSSFPQIYECNGKIERKDSNYNAVSFDKTSTSYFESYINQCKNIGYKDGIYSTESFYRAVGRNGYLIVVQNDSKLKAALVTMKFTWPSSGVAEFVPKISGVAGKLFGEIRTNDKSTFEFSVYGLNKNEIDDYIGKCRESGYVNDESKDGTTFSAVWKRSWFQSDYKLTIDYSEFDHITVKAEKL